MLQFDNRDDRLGIFSGANKGEHLKHEYRVAKPFPHLIIDNILPEDTAEAAYQAFPDAEANFWTEYGRFYQKEDTAAKLEAANSKGFPDSLRRVVDLLNSSHLIEFLKSLTGYDDLEYDETLTGGGLNLVPEGGMLRVHADFNYSNELQAFRTVNLIYYLNKNWDESHGGCLELWDPSFKSGPEIVVPSFNRAAVFNTNSVSYHGYKPVQSHSDGGRKSVNFYYYSKIPRRDVRSKPHKTLWLNE